jgi:capsid protein
MSKAIDSIIERGTVAAAVAPSVLQPAAATSSSAGYGTSGGGGFQGADMASELRGMVYFPELDTRKEINPTNRKEMMRKARWCVNNIGVCKRAINGLSRMVIGNGLTPQPLTSDKEWNELALAAFIRRTSQANVFDVSEKYNFARSQIAVVRCRLRDGDMGVALTESATRRARFAFYEAHQIGTSRWITGASPFETDGWYDGIYTDSLNAARRYRILGDDNKYTDFLRRDFLHQCDFERPGQRRGVTVLHHALNNILDITEIKTLFKMGIKSANRTGYYLADKGTPASNAGTGIAAQMAAAVEKMQTASGDTINLETVYGDGGEVPNVPAGKELRLLLDQRPHPNTLGFLDYIIRDIAWGCGISPELLWNITKLGGANTRFILADAQGFIEEQQQLVVDQYCSPVWNYTIAKEIKHGNLRPCNDPDWMFRMGWIPPARVTVDFGRDGKLHMAQLERGMLTFKKFYGWAGQDWRPNVEQWIDERAYMIKYASDTHGLSMSELLSTLPKSPDLDTDTAAQITPDSAD